ncbi:MAG: alginate O-acetyltransferase AlgX-related protein [Planctomycetota bacterium]
MESLTTKVRRAADIATIGLFALVIWLPTGDWVFDLDDAPTPVEKRELARMPEIEDAPEAIARFPSEFELYFNDNFGYRKRLVRWHNKVATKWLSVPSSPNVIFGREGWLFYAGEGVLDYQRARSPFSSEELLKWQRVLEERRNWLASRGIRYLVVVAPNKHSIHPEFLPGWMNRVGDATRLEQLLAHMEACSDIDMLDLRGPVIDAKRDGMVYSRTDTHWNDRGAFAAYGAIVRRLSEWFPQCQPLPRTAFSWRVERGPGGDLAVMLGQQHDMEEERPVLAPLSPRLARAADPGDLATRGPRAKGMGPLVMERSDHQIPRAVMFRDSFSVSLVPFLSEHFGRIVYLWQYEFDTEAVERERPNVVVQEIIERALTNIRPTNPSMGPLQGTRRRDSPPRR